MKGKKTILVLASGYDTFSKLTYDNTMKLLAPSDVGIYTIGTGQWVQDAYGGTGGLGDIRSQVAKSR